MKLLSLVTFLGNVYLCLNNYNYNLATREVIKTILHVEIRRVPHYLIATPLMHIHIFIQPFIFVLRACTLWPRRHLPRHTGCSKLSR